MRTALPNYYAVPSEITVYGKLLTNVSDAKKRWITIPSQGEMFTGMSQLFGVRRLNFSFRLEHVILRGIGDKWEIRKPRSWSSEISIEKYVSNDDQFLTKHIRAYSAATNNQVSGLSKRHLLALEVRIPGSSTNYARIRGCFGITKADTEVDGQVMTESINAKVYNGNLGIEIVEV